MSTLRARALDWAEIADAWRIAPRLLLVCYGAMLWRISEWFMSLPDPSGSQTAFVSTAWGAAGVVTGLYFNSGRRWQ